MRDAACPLSTRGGGRGGGRVGAPTGGAAAETTGRRGGGFRSAAQAQGRRARSGRLSWARTSFAQVHGGSWGAHRARGASHELRAQDLVRFCAAQRRAARARHAAEARREAVRRREESEAAALRGGPEEGEVEGGVDEVRAPAPAARGEAAGGRMLSYGR